MKRCNTCLQEKDPLKFGITGSGKKYRRNTCRSCMSLTRSPVKKEERKVKKAAWSVRYRKDNIAKMILQDCRNSDRKKNRIGNDLTLEFIQHTIMDGCSYCGGFDLRLTLDRIDNSLAHTQSNVKPACVRCNYARGNMPYEAWLCLTAGMKEAREKGLFGSWIGKLDKS